MVWRIAKLATTRTYYAWAERDIDKLHEDVPEIVRRRHALEEQWRELLRSLA